MTKPPDAPSRERLLLLCWLYTSQLDLEIQIGDKHPCKHQPIYGAEFTALKVGVEEAVTLRYHLRSRGVKISKATPIWVDNMAVVLNATKPGSAWNKKSIALAYLFCTRTSTQIRDINSED
jgi:hypothetical protein